MDTMRAYMRGLFLINGSINDPKKSRYHLEFLVDNEAYANFMMNNLNEFYLNSKVIKRDNKYMIYIKNITKILAALRVELFRHKGFSVAKLRHFINTILFANN